MVGALPRSVGPVRVRIKTSLLSVKKSTLGLYNCLAVTVVQLGTATLKTRACFLAKSLFVAGISLKLLALCDPVS